MKVVGAEVLARWDHPEKGMLAPGEFIDVAEESGLITRLGDRVLILACRQGRAWLENGLKIPLAVNVSIRQLEKPGFTSRILDILEFTGFPPDLLQLEVTETVAMADPERVSEATKPLLEAGITFAIDDFGTGYSSLSHIRHFPVDVIKIDRSFIKDMQNSSTDAILVKLILELSKQLKFNVVSEGVETKEQFEQLRAWDCDLIQGFLFYKPLPSTDYAELLLPQSAEIIKLNGINQDTDRDLAKVSF